MTEKPLTIETLENTTIDGTQTTRIRVNGTEATIKHQPGYVTFQIGTCKLIWEHKASGWSLSAGTVPGSPLVLGTIASEEPTRAELTDNQGRTFYAELDRNERLKLVNPELVSPAD